MDPLIIFFVFGLLARVLRSELALPEALGDTLAILLLLAIGLKGGVALHDRSGTELVVPALAIVSMGVVLTVLGFAVLRRFVHLNPVDAAAVAGHYGSVSVGTFAIASAAYEAAGVRVEPELALYAVLLEAPAIIVGVFLARRSATIAASLDRGALMHEILLGKSVVLLLGGLAIGWMLGTDGIAPVAPLFFDGFRAMLALFLLGLGLRCGERLASLRAFGARLLAFAIVMPVASAGVGALLGRALGLDVGGTAMLATLAASASYIAAPAAFRVALPDANPSLALTPALGITFPFNVTVGIPAYLELARIVHATL